jgi:hypothetical protein
VEGSIGGVTAVHNLKTMSMYYRYQQPRLTQPTLFEARSRVDRLTDEEKLLIDHQIVTFPLQDHPF